MNKKFNRFIDIAFEICMKVLMLLGVCFLIFVLWVVIVNWGHKLVPANFLLTLNKSSYFEFNKVMDLKKNDLSFDLVNSLQSNYLENMKSYSIGKAGRDTFSCRTTIIFRKYFSSELGHTCDYWDVDEEGFQEVIGNWEQWIEDEYPQWAEENLQ